MKKKHTSLGFIPARANSKGIKKKNMAMLGNKPLIAHTIESALKSQLDKLFVSTDSEEIAEIARGYNIEVPFLRPKSLAGDTDTIEEALIYTLNKLEKEQRFKPDIIALLQPTSPFRTATYINESLAIHKNTGESVISISEPMEHPAEMVYWKNNKMSFLIDDILPGKQQRQDYPQYYFVNGMIYIFSYHQIMHYQSRYSKFTKPFVTETLKSIDIDTPEDLRIANIINSHNV